MSKKNIFVDQITDEGLTEPESFGEPEMVVQSGPGDDIFDFTIGPEVMSHEAYQAYYKVAHIALTRGDASLMPAGKVMTRNQIEALLGGEIGATQQGKCC
jgi:hypothetical protein